MSLSTRCKSINKMADFVVSTLVVFHQISTVVKRVNINIKNSCIVSNLILIRGVPINPPPY